MPMRFRLIKRGAGTLPDEDFEIGDGTAPSMMGRFGPAPERVGDDAFVAALNHVGEPGMDEGVLKDAGHPCPGLQPQSGRHGRIWGPDSALYG